MPTRYWTPELIYEAFQNWEKTHGTLPRSGDWTKTQPDRKFKEHPTNRTVLYTFGSWERAIAAYEGQRKKKRWKIWSKEEIIEALQRWEKDEGRPPARQDVGSPEQGGRLPSMTSIKRHFGSFREAMIAAGFQPLPPGVSRRAVERFRPLPRRGGS